MITNLAMWVSRTALGLLRKYGMWTTLVPLGLGMDGGGCAGGGGGGGVKGEGSGKRGKVVTRVDNIWICEDEPKFNWYGLRGEI